MEQVSSYQHNTISNVHLDKVLLKRIAVADPSVFIAGSKQLAFNET